MVLWYVFEPHHILPFDYRLGLCTDSVIANGTLQFFFPVNTILLLDSSLGRSSSLSPIYSIPKYYVFLGAPLFCFYLYFLPCKRCQEAELYLTHFTCHSLNDALKDASASNPNHELFGCKAVT